MKTLILSVMLMLSKLTPQVQCENNKIKISSECQYEMILTDNKGRTLINQQQECGQVSIDLTQSPKGTYTLIIKTKNEKEIKREINIK